MNRKRVDIVSIRLVKEASTLWEYRKIQNPTDAYNLLKNFLSLTPRMSTCDLLLPQIA